MAAVWLFSVVIISMRSLLDLDATLQNVFLCPNLHCTVFFLALKTPAYAEIKHKSRRAEKAKDKDEEKKEKYRYLRAEYLDILCRA